MLDMKTISHWLKTARTLFDAKTVGGWYGALKASLFIVGLMLIFGGAVWIFVLICKLMVLGLLLIGQTASEFSLLYSEQIPLVQLVFLIALCWLVLWGLSRSCRLIWRTVRPTPAYIHVTARGRTTNAYSPRFHAGYYGRNAYGYGS